MAVVVEYIILLTAYFEYKSIQIAKIEITNTHFVLYDGNLQEIHRARRLAGGVAIVSDNIPGLTYGTVLRFIISSQKLYAVDDMEGQKEVECTVTAPEG